MKKNYIAPQIETTFYELVLMQTATKVTGSITDGNNQNQGQIGWEGESDEDDNPDAKSGNLWDGWDD